MQQKIATTSQNPTRVPSPTPTRCAICESPEVERVHYEGNALLWFICQKCKHVWCALTADYPPAR